MAQMDIKKASGLLLAGALAGATIALLYAPQSGARTKKDLRKLARKTANSLDDLQGDIREQVTDWVDNMSEVVQDGLERGKKFGADGYDQVLQTFDSAKKYVEDGRTRIERIIKSA